MPDNTTLNKQENQTGLSLLSEVESFYQVPESSPLMIVNDSPEIIFFNGSFKNNFLQSGIRDFFSIKMEPDLKYLLSTLSKSNYNNFQFDLYISPEDGLRENHYGVEVERVLLDEQKYNVVIFKSLKEKNNFEERINNLHIALEYGKIPVIITDQNGMIKYSTTSFEEILKFNIEEVFNKSISGALSSYLVPEEIIVLDQSILENKEWTKTIFRILDNGSPEYYEIKLKPVYKIGEDLPSFILTANDITHYVLKNLFIKNSESRLKSIINHISDLLLIFQKKKNDYIFENANDNFCKMFSVDKNKAINKKLNTIIPKSFFRQLQVSLQEFYIKESPIVEFTHRSVDGKEYSAKITFIEPKTFEDTLFILSMQDITDQVLYRMQLEKAYEKEINLNKLKTAFLENMSHEIRTPFNAVLGYSDIIDDCVKEKDYETIVDLISSFKDVLNRVLNLFNNIVEVFQISSGEIEIELVTLNINQVVRSVFNNRLEEANAKNLDFLLDLEEDDLNIKTDWIKFEKIINSLVDNAIKYTEKGSITLSSKRVQDKTELRIIDTGKGIKTDNIKRLYEPFVQEEEAYMRNYEGAGLGLTIAYKLTQLMGGKFDIKSELNIGTKIILTFPLLAGSRKN